MPDKKTYKIKSGDTLFKIAQKYKMTISELISLNPEYRGFIEDPKGGKIYAGDILNLSKGESKGESSSGINFNVLKGASKVIPRKEQWNNIKDDVKSFTQDVKSVVMGEKDFNETGIGQFLGSGKPIEETKLGKALGGGKELEDTAFGKALNLKNIFSKNKKDLSTNEAVLSTDGANTLSQFNESAQAIINKYSSNVEKGDFLPEVSGYKKDISNFYDTYGEDEAKKLNEYFDDYSIQLESDKPKVNKDLVVDGQTLTQTEYDRYWETGEMPHEYTKNKKPFKETKVGKFFTKKEKLVKKEPVIDRIRTMVEKDKSDWVSSFTPKEKRKYFMEETQRIKDNLIVEENKNKAQEAAEFFSRRYKGGGLVKKYEDGGIDGGLDTGEIDYDALGQGVSLLGEGMEEHWSDEDPTTMTFGETAGTALSGIGKGAAIGSTFGLPGAAIGATIGLITNLIGGLGKRKKARKREVELGIESSIHGIASSQIGGYKQRMEDELASEEMALEKHRGISMARGGMISPEVAPFLSDSYKRYLAGGYALGGEVKKRRPEHLKYEYASGGMVYGKSHKKGGEKFNVGGEVVELEGGEAVMNKKSTEMFKPILSKMNQAGGGVSFARGGLTQDPYVQTMMKRLINKSR